MKDIVKDFGIVYGSMVGAMLAFAGATIITSAVIELVAAVKR